MGEKRRIALAAIVMSAATLISRVLGFVRDITMTFFFGASGVTDAFFVAFKIPNMLREIFAEGSMSAAVIPVMTGYEKDDPAGGRRLIRTLLGFSLVVVGTVCALGAIFAPEVVSIIGMGFLKSPEKSFAFDITVELARYMMPFLLFTSLASILMAALNARRVFFIPALSPAMFNLTMIAAIMLLATRFERPIFAAAIGVSIGGLVQVLFQAPRFLVEGHSLLPSFRFNHPGLRRILVLMLPVMGSMAVSQINIVVGAMLATMLPFGSVTYLFYSMRLIQFPIGIFGVAMGMAVLPSLSSHAHAGDMDNLKEDFSFSLRLLLFLGIPAMAGLISLRVPIVATLFQHGRFEAVDTLATAHALLYYSLGLWAVMGVKVLNSTFYSLSDTRIPVIAASVALISNVLLSLLLMGPMLHSGLALAQAMSAMANFSLLMYFLYGKIGRMGGRDIAVSFLKSLAAAAIMSLALWPVAGRGLWTEAGGTAHKALLLMALISGAVALYAAAAYFMGSKELVFVVKLLKDKIAKEKV